MNKCAGCGKFKPWDQLHSMAGENDEVWFECLSCMSPADLADIKAVTSPLTSRKGEEK